MLYLCFSRESALGTGTRTLPRQQEDTYIPSYTCTPPILPNLKSGEATLKPPLDVRIGPRYASSIFPFFLVTSSTKCVPNKAERRAVEPDFGFFVHLFSASDTDVHEPKEKEEGEEKEEEEAATTTFTPSPAPQACSQLASSVSSELVRRIEKGCMCSNK